jgi:hypothetical protein
MTTEPMEILLRAALERLRIAGVPMREDGWDANISVERAESDEDHVYDARLSIRIGHFLRIPDEARTKLAARGGGE